MLHLEFRTRHEVPGETLDHRRGTARGCAPLSPSVVRQQPTTIGTHVPLERLTSGSYVDAVTVGPAAECSGIPDALIRG